MFLCHCLLVSCDFSPFILSCSKKHIVKQIHFGGNHLPTSVIKHLIRFSRVVSWDKISRKLVLMPGFVQRNVSTLISAIFQVPNPLFDLAGIMCGQFGIPFWEFFFATLVGKAIIKTHIQVCKGSLSRLGLQEAKLLSIYKLLHFLNATQSLLHPLRSLCLSCPVQTIFIIAVCNNQLLDWIENELIWILSFVPGFSSVLPELISKLNAIKAKYLKAPSHAATNVKVTL